jgi:hypothetical protein
MFIEGYVRFVDLKILNDERVPMIADSFVTIVSSLTAQNYMVAAIYSDTTLNEASVFNGLSAFSLPRQAQLPRTRIPCITHITNRVLSNFLSESRGAKLFSSFVHLFYLASKEISGTANVGRRFEVSTSISIMHEFTAPNGRGKILPGPKPPGLCIRLILLMMHPVTSFCLMA